MRESERGKIENSGGESKRESVRVKERVRETVRVRDRE